MNTTQALHHEAMQLAERADLSRLQGDEETALQLTRTAFFKEREAATIAVSEQYPEPTRSILLRSAATLAAECKKWSEVRALTKAALKGNPPQEIRAELLKLQDRSVEKPKAKKSQHRSRALASSRRKSLAVPQKA